MSFEVLITFCNLKYLQQSKFFSRKEKSPLWINSILESVSLLSLFSYSMQGSFYNSPQRLKFSFDLNTHSDGELVHMFTDGQTQRV